MKQTHCRSDAKHIRHFLNACEGNWHSCIYVRCNTCQTIEKCHIPDFLFHPDETASPCILLLSDTELLFSRTPKPDECLKSMTIAEFLQLYKAYLAKAELSSDGCPVLELLHLQESSHYDW